MNVLNLNHIERELVIVGARAVHDQVRKWFLSVARNYIVNLEDATETHSEFETYTPKRPKKGVHTDLPTQDQLPTWAKEAVAVGKPVHFFNPAQPRRRAFWKAAENICDWFNTFKGDDPVLGRIDKISFQTARQESAEWRAKIDSNPWLYIRDKPTVIKTYDDGLHWVRLSTEAHMTREGELMGHCVGAHSYTSSMRAGTTEYYSLRDKQNEPHVTVEVRPSGASRSVTQMKGKQNKRAVDKYQKYLRDFVTQPGWTVAGDTDKLV